MEKPTPSVRPGTPPLTKVTLPTSTTRTLPRVAVEEILGRGARVTAVVGPAGFGKTSAVATWAARQPGPVAWYTVDAVDGRPSVFWWYLTEAIGRVCPLTPADRDSTGAWATPDAEVDRLLAALGDHPPASVVVIDDLHLVDEHAIFEQLQYFIERAPAALRFVLVTRKELPLPFGRWAVRGLLAEVSEEQLSMDRGEAEALVRDVAPANVADAAVDRVVDIAAGWPAALRLAGLNLDGLADRFVPAASAEARYFFEFVADEVLAGLPDDLRTTVVELSLFDDLDPRRCESFCGVADGRALLDQLVKQGLPMVVLDRSTHSHRLHALFRELLATELLRTRARELRELHARVAAVELAVGDQPAAARHLIAAGDLEQAFELAFGPLRELYRSGSVQQMAQWIDRFPTEFVAGDAERCATLAVTMGYLGRQEEADRWSRAASELTDGATLHQDEVVTLSRVIPALDRGDTDTIRLEVQALHARHGADAVDRECDSQLHTVMAIASLVDERLEDAACWVPAMVRRPDMAVQLRTVGYPTRAAWDAYLRGSLEESAELARAALDARTDAGGSATPVTIELFSLLAGLALERLDLDEADHWLARATRRAEQTPLGLHRYLIDRVAVATTEARAGSERALHALRRMHDVTTPTLAVRYELLAADLEARSGMRAAAARRLALLPPSARRSVLSARLAALAERPEAVREHLAGLGEIPRALRIEATLVEARVVPGSDALERAVDLGAVAGYVWTYRREGPVLDRPLSRTVAGDPRWSRTALAEALHPATAGVGQMVAILSPAERRVLVFLPSHLSVAEIAAELHLSPNTVKTHLRSLYRKLGADRRSEAVRRAERLGLLR